MLSSWYAGGTLLLWQCLQDIIVMYLLNRDIKELDISQIKTLTSLLLNVFVGVGKFMFISLYTLVSQDKKNVDRDILRRTMKFLFMGSEQAKQALRIAILLDIKVNLNHAKLRLLNVCIDIKCLMRIFKIFFFIVFK